MVFIGHLTKEPDGWKLIEKIRETDKELPVYVLTTNMGGSEEQYRSRGFTGRLIKPIDSMVLERTIMRHLPEAIMQKKEGEPG